MAMCFNQLCRHPLAILTEHKIKIIIADSESERDLTHVVSL